MHDYTNDVQVMPIIYNISSRILRSLKAMNEDNGISDNLEQHSKKPYIRTTMFRCQAGKGS